jgi:hypothetical protein
MTSKMLSLPNELLFNIFSCIPEHSYILVHQGFPGPHRKHEPMKELAVTEVKTLLNLALVCRRFTRIAQEVLLKSPALICGELVVRHTRLIALILLLARLPFLRYKVRSLRVEVEQFSRNSNILNYKNDMREVILRGCMKIVDQQIMDQDSVSQQVQLSARVGVQLTETEARSSNYTRWKTALCQGKEAAFVGVLLSLLPNLEMLAFIPKPYHGRVSPDLTTLFGILHVSMIPPFARHLPGFQKLNYLKLVNKHPARSIGKLPAIQTVDLVFRDMDGGLLAPSYPTIIKLRLATTVSDHRFPHNNGSDTSFLVLLKRLLPRLPNLKAICLYDESDCRKLVDVLPPSRCACIRPFTFDFILWQLYRTHVDIETIGLPENWVGRPMLSALLEMPPFPRLRRVIVPACAIYGLVRTREPVDIFPSSLEFFRITDVDAPLMLWLFGFFKADKFHQLKELELAVSVAAWEAYTNTGFKQALVKLWMLARAKCLVKVRVEFTDRVWGVVK